MKKRLESSASLFARKLHCINGRTISFILTFIHASPLYTRHSSPSFHYQFAPGIRVRETRDWGGDNGAATLMAKEPGRHNSYYRLSTCGVLAKKKTNPQLTFFHYL